MVIVAFLYFGAHVAPLLWAELVGLLRGRP
jgi:hypothetical protein